MPLAKLLYEAGIDVAAFDKDADKIARTISKLGEHANITFQREIGRSLANAIDADIPEKELRRLNRLLRKFGQDASKTFQQTFSRKKAREMLSPFIKETETFTGKLKAAFTDAFSVGRLAAGVAAGIGITRGIDVIIESLGRLKDISIEAALEFEYNVNRIKTIAGETFIRPKIEQDLKRIATQVPQDLTELSMGLFQTITSGIRDVTKAVGVLDTASKAAIAGATDASIATDALTTILNAYGFEAEKAGEISDVLFRIVDQGKVFFDELARAIGDVANPAAVAKVSFRDLGAALAVMTKAGINIEESTTALRNFLIELAKPADKVREFAKSLGVDFSIAGMQAAGGLVPFIKRIYEVTQGSAEMLAKFSANRRSLRFLTVVAGSGAEEFQRLGQIFRDNTFILGATERAFDTMAESIKVQRKLFVDAAKVWLVDFGESLLKLIDPLLQFGLRILDNRTELQKYYDTLKKVSVLQDEFAVASLGDDYEKLVQSFQKTGIDEENLVFFKLQVQIESLENALKELDKAFENVVIKFRRPALERFTTQTVKDFARPFLDQFKMLLEETDAGTIERMRRLLELNKQITAALNSIASLKRRDEKFEVLSDEQIGRLNIVSDALSRMNKALKEAIFIEQQRTKTQQLIDETIQKQNKALDDQLSEQEKLNILNEQDLESIQKKNEEMKQLSQLMRKAAVSFLESTKGIRVGQIARTVLDFEKARQDIIKLSFIEESVRKQAIDRLKEYERAQLEELIRRVGNIALYNIQRNSQIGFANTLSNLRSEFDIRRKQIDSLIDIEKELRLKMIDSLTKAEQIAINKLFERSLRELSKSVKKSLDERINIKDRKQNKEARFGLIEGQKILDDTIENLDSNVQQINTLFSSLEVIFLDFIDGTDTVLMRLARRLGRNMKYLTQSLSEAIGFLRGKLVGPQAIVSGFGSLIYVGYQIFDMFRKRNRTDEEYIKRQLQKLEERKRKQEELNREVEQFFKKIEQQSYAQLNEELINIEEQIKKITGGAKALTPEVFDRIAALLRKENEITYQLNRAEELGLSLEQIAKLEEQGEIIRQQLLEFAKEFGAITNVIISDELKALIEKYRKLNEEFLNFGKTQADFISRFKRFQFKLDVDDVENTKDRLNLFIQFMADKFGVAIPASAEGIDTFVKNIFNALETLSGTELEKFLSEFNLSQFTEEELQRLLEILEKFSDELKNSSESISNSLQSILDTIELEFRLLDIEDPSKKIRRIVKDINKFFSASLPEQFGSLQQLIEEFVSALTSGTLDQFKQFLGLEELTREEFIRLFEQLEDLLDSAFQDIAQIQEQFIEETYTRGITFEQATRLIDEVTTMRILVTEMTDILREIQTEGLDIKTPLIASPQNNSSQTVDLQTILPVS